VKAGVIPERFGVKVTLDQLVNHAESVTDCPAVIVVALGVNVHVAHPVFTAGPQSPVQSILHFHGCQLRGPSSHVSFGVTVLLVLHGRNHSVDVWIPPLPSVVPVALSVTQSPQRAT
jgi:hypothetical protein